MRISSWADTERWEWFAAGDPAVASTKVARSTSAKNSARQLLFESGIVLVVPLAVAAVLEIVLGR